MFFRSQKNHFKAKKFISWAGVKMEVIIYQNWEKSDTKHLLLKPGFSNPWDVLIKTPTLILFEREILSSPNHLNLFLHTQLKKKKKKTVFLQPMYKFLSFKFNTKHSYFERRITYWKDFLFNFYYFFIIRLFFQFPSFFCLLFIYF